MYARGTALVVLAILLFSSFSGMVSGSTIEGYDQSVDNSDQVSPDESNWTLFENPVGHLHQIKQSSGLIHSPFGSFDPLDQEIPRFEWDGGSIGADQSDRPVYIIQSSDSDISSIVSTVQEYGGSILDYIPDNSLLVRFSHNAPGDLIINSIDGVRWFGIMPDLWRISPEILSVEPTSLVDLEILPAGDISKSELASLEKELSSLSNAEVPNARCDSWLCTVRGIQSGWAPLLSTDWRILHIQIQSTASVHNSDCLLYTSDAADE